MENTPDLYEVFYASVVVILLGSSAGVIKCNTLLKLLEGTQALFE